MPTVIKPFHLGVSHRVLVTPPKHLLVVSLFGFFDLTKPDDLVSEQEMWPFLLEALGPGVAFDGGLPKLHCEVLLGGSGAAPGGKPVERLVLDLKIGTIDKRLVATGQRYWKPTLSGGFEVTRPTPLTECPLDFRAAFGGAASPKNPVGRGHGARAALERGEVAPLPVLEDPRQAVTDIDGAPEPASFGPIGIAWPQRAQHAGTYDAVWAATRWPAPPVDMRWELFNEASKDQWNDVFFRGDERFTLGGMNADEPLLRGELPGMVGRCFVKTGAGQIREVPTRIDTVWLFGGAKKGVVVFRGVKEVADSDASEVSHILAAYERLLDPRRGIDHYEDVFAKRTDPDTGFAYMIADSQLGPVVSPEELARREAERTRLAEERGDAFKKMLDAQLAKQAGMAEPLARARAEMAKAAPDAAQDVSASQRPKRVIPAITPGDIARKDVDLAGVLSAVAALQVDMKAELDKGKAAVEQARRDGEKRLAEQGLSLEGSGDKEADQRRFVEAAAGVEPRKGLGALLDVEAFLGMLGQSKMADADMQKTRAQLSEADKLTEGLDKARRVSPKPIDLRDPLLPAVAVYFGELIRQGLQEGRAYRGRDLAGADLRGARLAGLDLSGTFFERCNLEGADLTGANLNGAVLTGANLRGAKLTQAWLREANLCEIDAAGADLSYADLQGAKLMGAKLGAARLSNAKLRDVQAMNAELTDARLDGADLTDAVLFQANLDGACADGADLTKVTLLQASLKGATFRGAKLVKAVLVGAQGDDACFDGADLTEAAAGAAASFARGSFREIRGIRAGFRSAILDNASFERAVLDEADFGGAKLRRAKLGHASLKRAVLTGADLRDAVLRHANLLEALLRKAILDRADLEHANLYAANTDEASFTDAHLSHANTGRTRIRR